MEAYKPWGESAYYDGFNVERETLGVSRKDKIGAQMSFSNGAKFDVEITKAVLDTIRSYHPREVRVKEIANYLGLSYERVRNAIETLSTRSSLYIKVYYSDGTEVPEEVQDKNAHIGRNYYGLLKPNESVREVEDGD